MRRDYKDAKDICASAAVIGWVIVGLAMWASYVAVRETGLLAAAAVGLPGLAGGFVLIVLAVIGRAAAGIAEATALLASRESEAAAEAAGQGIGQGAARRPSPRGAALADGIELRDGLYWVGAESFPFRADAERHFRGKTAPDVAGAVRAARERHGSGA